MDDFKKGVCKKIIKVLSIYYKLNLTFSLYEEETSIPFDLAGNQFGMHLTTLMASSDKLSSGELKMQILLICPYDEMEN